MHELIHVPVLADCILYLHFFEFIWFYLSIFLDNKVFQFSNYSCRLLQLNLLILDDFLELFVFYRCKVLFFHYFVQLIDICCWILIWYDFAREATQLLLVYLVLNLKLPNAGWFDSLIQIFNLHLQVFYLLF